MNYGKLEIKGIKKTQINWEKYQELSNILDRELKLLCLKTGRGLRDRAIDYARDEALNGIELGMFDKEYIGQSVWAIRNYIKKAANKSSAQVGLCEPEEVDTDSNLMRADEMRRARIQWNKAVNKDMTLRQRWSLEDQGLSRRSIEAVKKLGICPDNLDLWSEYLRAWEPITGTKRGGVVRQGVEREFVSAINVESGAVEIW